MKLDYHLAEVRTNSFDAPSRHYIAWCKCGWHGPTRDSKKAAEDDSYEHDRMENN